MQPPTMPERVRALYPTVDWSQVELVRRMPWYARRKAAAMVVPDVLHRRRVRVHVRPHIDLESPAGHGLLVHEAYHVWQYQQDRWGWGPVRPFVLSYLLLALRHGFGPEHPMEGPAYAAQRAHEAGARRREGPPRREA